MVTNDIFAIVILEHNNFEYGDALILYTWLPRQFFVAYVMFTLLVTRI